MPRPAVAQQRMSMGELEVAVKKDSNDPVLHYNLAQAYARAKRGREAKQQYLAAMRIDDQFEPAVTALAMMAQNDRPILLILRLGNRYVLIGGHPNPHDSTLMLVRRAFALDPIQDLRTPGHWGYPQYWANTFERAVGRYQSGEYQAARDLCDTILAGMRKQSDADSGIATVWWYHLLASAGLEDYDRAIEDGEKLLDRALRLELADSMNTTERLSHEYEWVLAHLHQRARHYVEAERLYKRVAEADLGAYMAHVELANMDEAQNRLEDAVTERERAMAADIGDPSLELQAGLSYEYAGHHAQADTVLRQAIKDNPRETRSYYVLGLVDIALGRADDAKQALDQFLALAPSRYETMRTDARSRRAALN
ncbi:MAG TPA: tetratricopeptide repeat protein [Gemmatimonadales bacterium]|nr:tetratricopeptide repeat protein [Gemmatimonadales bacterium]